MQPQHIEIGEAIAQAVTLQRAGQFPQAEQLCHAILQVRPREPTTLHVLGVCLLQRGEYAKAEAVLAACLHAQPNQAIALTNLGIALHGLNRLEQALDCYEDALALHPDHPATLNMQGRTLLELGQLDRALAKFDRATKVAPELVEGWCGRARALAHLHRYDEAHTSLDRADALRPNDADALLDRGMVFTLQRKHDMALAATTRALELLPNRAEAHRLKADALSGLGKDEEALASYTRAIDIDPRDCEALAGRAAVFGRLGKSDRAARDFESALELTRARPDSPHAALAIADRALELRSDCIRALRARGTALLKLRRHDEALVALQRLGEVVPNDIEIEGARAAALRQLDRWDECLEVFDALLRRYPLHAAVITARADILALLGRHQEALEGFAKAVELDPNLQDAHWNEALLRLTLGQFDIGWRKYESRWERSSLVRSKQHFRQPRFTGREHLSGQTVFLHAEQGMGDEIQFVRYAPILAARGCTVIIGADRALKPLLETLAGVTKVVSDGEGVPPFDLHAPLLSLPHALGTTLESIPDLVPYLVADPGLVVRWIERLGQRRRARIGLAWAGNPEHWNDRRRSIPLALLERLISVPADFHCLTKDVRDGDRDLMGRFGIRFFGEELTDFAETAALTSLMDLVISVDTSIAHLAGALAMPLWLLIPNPPEWRWLLDREDSPWYPTARLFRQRARGDWPEVIARVASELRAFVAARPHATAAH